MILTVKQICLSYRLSEVIFDFISISSSRYPPENKRSVLSRRCYLYRKWNEKNQSIPYSVGNAVVGNSNVRNHVHPFRVINNLFAVIIPATGHASIAFNSPCCFLLLNPGLGRANLSPIIISSLFTVGRNQKKKKNGKN